MTKAKERFGYQPGDVEWLDRENDDDATRASAANGKPSTLPKNQGSTK